jgi:amino acid permease
LVQIWKNEGNIFPWLSIFSAVIKRLSWFFSCHCQTRYKKKQPF